MTDNHKPINLLDSFNEGKLKIGDVIKLRNGGFGILSRCTPGGSAIKLQGDAYESLYWNNGTKPGFNKDYDIVEIVNP